jgi:uncharacterized membrane protein
MTTPQNNLWALAFDDQYKADEARVLFRRMAGEGLLVLQESAVATVGLDGKATITQDVDVTSTRRNQGHWVGIVAAAITGITPLIMAGTIAGQVVGRLTDQGITKQKMQPIIDALQPETSALFVLGYARNDKDRGTIVERLRHLSPRIVQASVSPVLRQQIEALIDQAPATSTS